ncbi:MFS transporter [Amycolatopsis rubida]|uniref:MFS transporter n=1 Tax=Amycolatopsis rubida TaxID=112413 RepID=A0ABX0BM27_9PSEU|nr:MULTISPECIES: MDR family MFS transporter [Amycolatopsis]MYW91690.1 MFS transporter [Amycolatopsis rubida]NEC56674.1 MFS transporter [Amycolatopsis rubida]OAP20435.1 Multidrug resistance protein 3 [Amycolatopsis sp. M39]
MTATATRRGWDRATLIVFPGFMLATLMAGLDQTIVATALPSIAADLSGLSHLAWVVTAYGLAVGVSTPVHGKLGDLFPRKLLFQLSVATFLAGSALCGTAWSMPALIAFRVLQGIGAGGIVVHSQSILGELIPPAERGRYLGFMQSAFAVSTVAGPLLGGVLAENLGWRWAFYVNLPFGALALAVVAVNVPRGAPRRGEARIDWLGAVLLSTGITALLLVTGWGGREHGWGSPLVLALAAGAVVLLTALLWWERRAREPMLPLRLFGNPVARVVFSLVFLLGFTTVGLTIFVPLFFQLADRVTPTASGMRLAPLWLSWAVASTAAGQFVARTGRYRVLPITGAALVTAALVLWWQMPAGTAYGAEAGALVLAGIGLGMINSVMLIVVQNAVAAGDIGVATSTTTFSQTIGASSGVAVFGSVFAAGLAGGYPAAVHGVFLLAAATAVLALATALCLREIPLRKVR